MQRRFGFGVTVLALLAALSQWLVWLNRERPASETFTGPPRSDYTLDDFTLTALDRDGRRSFEIRAPRLARRGDDGSIYVTQPSYVLVDADDHAWHGTSATAWVDKEGSLMHLGGEVRLEREADAEGRTVLITTRELEARPRAHSLATAEPAIITQPGSILRGTGLRADLDAKTLELLSDVHINLQTRRRAAPAARR